ncbi:MAG: hypothetical protein ACLVEX_02105 [Ruthenibacterium lactatiformans]
MVERGIRSSRRQRVRAQRCVTMPAVSSTIWMLSPHPRRYIVGITAASPSPAPLRS